MSENRRDFVGKNDSDASKLGGPIEFVDLANVELKRGSKKKKMPPVLLY